MNRLIPDTLAARTVVVLIIGLALSHAISVGLYMSDRAIVLVSGVGEHVGDRINVVDRLVRNTPKPERAEVLKRVDNPRLHATLTSKSAVSVAEDQTDTRTHFTEALNSHLNPDPNRQLRLKYVDKPKGSKQTQSATSDMADGSKAETMLISLSLPDGQWLNVTVTIRKPGTFWGLRFGLSLVVMLAAVLLLSGLVAYNLTKPLAVFASAAQRLGVDVRAPPLPVTGPAEIRQASGAFNEMQDRIRRFVEDRTQMIAAIAHDLGTPIARLRLRSEYVEDAEQHDKMLADLDDMEKMVFSTLAFARDDADAEPSTRVDLRILLQRICNDATDTGQEITLQIEDTAVPFTCRPATLRRALGNLVDNAAKYGQQAQVSCIQRANVIEIIIKDQGPGIPLARQEDVFKPFQRLERSRSRDTGGTGLGLTVARTIIRAHGGDIQLNNRAGGGLKVTVKLPC